jgi:hypothetical protein
LANRPLQSIDLARSQLTADLGTVVVGFRVTKVRSGGKATILLHL